MLAVDVITFPIIFVAAMFFFAALGIGNYLDLLAIRTRIPNFGGPEQARIDAEILNLVPFAQPSFLRALLGMPVRMRTNSRFHVEIIRRLAPVLATLPLAKSGMSYPFGLSTNISWLVTKAKSQMGWRHADQEPVALLQHVREYVLDTVHSSGVAANPRYDYPGLLDAVTNFYAGDLSLARTVDWWLTFQLWQESLALSSDAY